MVNFNRIIVEIETSCMLLKHLPPRRMPEYTKVGFKNCSSIVQNIPTLLVLYVIGPLVKQVCRTDSTIIYDQREDSDV